MSKPLTQVDLDAATEALLAAKKSRGKTRSGGKFDAYQQAAEQLSATRREFRAQEEQSGARSGFISGDAAAN